MYDSAEWARKKRIAKIGKSETCIVTYGRSFTLYPFSIHSIEMTPQLIFPITAILA